jgi:prephenate dehydrogenase
LIIQQTVRLLKLNKNFFLLLAAVSHLPHMIAYTLVNAVAEAGGGAQDALNYSAGGFRDFTRIASSSPEMWVDICAMNKDNIIDMIGKFEKTLAELKKQLIANDFEGVKASFEKAKRVRDSIAPNSGK